MSINLISLLPTVVLVVTVLVLLTKTPAMSCQDP